MVGGVLPIGVARGKTTGKTMAGMAMVGVATTLGVAMVGMAMVGMAVVGMKVVGLPARRRRWAAIRTKGPHELHRPTTPVGAAGVSRADTACSHVTLVVEMPQS